ncbi:hypothetical protein BB560_000119 [Smittium megazygosporum]|uniref:N-acetyltransferase domain-containing protein n=1 Tax=Smittium megazygosporum TaxID=133381 RepID=A0A2T9ZLA7_9FUNG|nr:hypothetical protein BB560_000119 [Smittium megazygosporum]
MKSEELLELTASEPLTLEEEYEMQESWHLDEKKCTFILAVQVDTHKDSKPDSSNENTETSGKSTVCKFDSKSVKLIGDVNIYLNDEEDKNRGEIEIMIAEKGFQGRGIAKEALKIMMYYAIKDIGLTSVYCRILEKNVASIKLFELLGFRFVERSEYFNEVTYEQQFDEEQVKKLTLECKHVVRAEYEGKK